MADVCYFTLPELAASFRLVTDDATAARMVRIWARCFGDRVVDDRVVELPEDFGLPRLAPPHHPDADVEAVDEYFDEMNHGIGVALIRFSGLTLDMLAGADPAVRARFDRMGVPYAYATLDDPERWRQLLAFIRQH